MSIEPENPGRGRLAIQDWVDQAPEQRRFRQAVHTILVAISGSADLQASMIMKGGLLLALGYASTRFTRDIDFSTATRRQDFDLEAFKQALDNALIVAVNRLSYGLDCRLQSCKQQPPREDATFPTLRIKIGYADQSDPRARRQLARGSSPHTVLIDYSLNEPTEEPDVFEIGDGLPIQTYSFADLVAEKFRALLQQENRNRVRRQDVYDLYLLLQARPDIVSDAVQTSVHRRLLEKCRLRNLIVTYESMDNPVIIERSRREYPSLATEIDGELPDFDLAYDQIRVFYRALPWVV